MRSAALPLAARGLTVAVPGRELVADLELALSPGEFLVVLGRNGAGKTLTLETLAGVRAAARGTIELDGRDIGAWSRAARARALALLPQESEDTFPSTVLETALIGRHPHLALLQLESDEDRAIASRALQRLDLLALADRDVLTLSGGERRRLAVAQLVTQSPGICLLDEPVNHLDPQHQLDVLALFASMAAGGVSVVATLHDVNLARRYADRALLLFGDGRWRLGAAAEVLTADTLSELFAVRMESVTWRDSELFVATAGREARPPG